MVKQEEEAETDSETSSSNYETTGRVQERLRPAGITLSSPAGSRGRPRLCR